MSRPGLQCHRFPAFFRSGRHWWARPLLGAQVSRHYRIDSLRCLSVLLDARVSSCRVGSLGSSAIFHIGESSPWSSTISGLNCLAFSILFDTGESLLWGSRSWELDSLPSPVLDETTKSFSPCCSRTLWTQFTGFSCPGRPRGGLLVLELIKTLQTRFRGFSLPEGQRGVLLEMSMLSNPNNLSLKLERYGLDSTLLLLSKTDEQHGDDTKSDEEIKTQRQLQ